MVQNSSSNADNDIHSDFPVKQRRTNQERIEDIFKFIEKQNGVFPKSQLKEVGLSPSAAEKWLNIIEFIQAQPKIRLIKTKNTTLVEKIEGKYQVYMRKLMIDESIPPEQRIEASNNYLRSLYSRERSGIGKQPHNPEKIRFDISSEEYFAKIREVAEVLSQINPLFKNIVHDLEIIDKITDEDQKSFEFSKIMKSNILNSDFKAAVKQILKKESVDRRIKQIEKFDPEYRHKFKLAMKFFDAQFDIWNK
ncbi:hypothetical protein [Candidatus Lokiarchaeum ossiferum]|uniref:hypothetical protein n=1 Tax=Candidatus Lokiarchaeum ossiferum TaxID=2951803 RepID=UPI00352E3F28